MSEAITTTPPTTPERKQFLFDVFVLALEGGIGYWFVCTKYQHLISDPGGTGPGSFEGLCDDVEGFFARGHEDGESKRITIDKATIEKGLYLIRNAGSGPALHVHPRLRARIIGAEGILNLGDIDVVLADIIVQVGLFGEVVYA